MLEKWKKGLFLFFYFFLLHILECYLTQYVSEATFLYISVLVALLLHPVVLPADLLYLHKP